MRKKFTLRVITTKEGDIDHSDKSVKGYIRITRLVPQLFEVEYIESEGRDKAIKNALAIIKKTDKTEIKGYDIIEKNQLTEF